MSETDAAFDALSDEFFSVWFRFHPDVAAEAGVSGFERLLPAQSDDEVSALGGWLESLIVALEELDYRSLEEGRRIDLRLMFSAARVEHQELLEQDWRHRDPLRYLPVGEIFQLTLRQPGNVRDALAGLLRQVPSYLRRAVAQLQAMAELVAPELAVAAVDEAQRGRCYLRELAGGSWLRQHCHGWSEIEGLIDAACDALSAYGESLRGEIAERAAGHPGCGQDHLRFLLKHRHFMELDLEAVHGLLTDARTRVDAALVSLYTEMGLTPEGAMAYLNANTVSESRRLDACRVEAGRLAAFLHESGLVRIPDVQLRISERPGCPRPQRFGADYIPDFAVGTGTFFLGALQDEERSEPRSVLRARCLDRTWGGAHLLAFVGGEEGWRLPRRLCSHASLVGGWGLYLRERLDELGYLDPDDRLFALLTRQWSIRHALLDLDLHRRALTGSKGLTPLDGISGADADDLVSLARRPGDALASVLGWLAMSRVRDRLRRRQGEGFTDSRFHDRLLSRGRIPLPLILDAELGEGGWSAIADDLGV